MKAESARRFRASARLKDNRPDQWQSTIVTIYDGDTLVGEYERNYPRFGEETFEPFELDGRWYALYSRDYTCTRVMTLPDCKDIGGEEPSSNGFCPVELFVPRYREVQTTKVDDPAYHREDWYFESKAEPWRQADADLKAGFRFQLGEWKTLDVGFVAGCIWGDDSTWKLQVFDLSAVREGKIKRSERFGFVELANIPLAQAVLCYRSHGFPLRATIVRQEDRDLRTGKYIDPYE